MINLQLDKYGLRMCIPKKFDSHVNIKRGEKYTPLIEDRTEKILLIGALSWMKPL